MFFFFKQKTAYEMRISDWSSDVCSSDLVGDEIAVHFWRFRALGTEHIRGYVFKDGQMSRIATVAADVAYDDQFWQTGYTADIVDEAGRATRIETDVFGCYTLKPVPNCSLNESGGRSMIDGKEEIGRASGRERGWPKVEN